MEEPTADPAASFLPAAATAQRSLGSLLGLSLRRPGGRRAVSLVTVVLLVSGVSMFAFPAFTALFQRSQQRHVQLNTSDPPCAPSTSSTRSRSAKDSPVSSS